MPPSRSRPRRRRLSLGCFLADSISRGVQAVGGAPAAFTFEPAGAINKHVRVIGVAGAWNPPRDEDHHCDGHNRQYPLLSYRLTAQSAREKLQSRGCHACCAVERAVKRLVCWEEKKRKSPGGYLFLEVPFSDFRALMTTWPFFVGTNRIYDKYLQQRSGHIIITSRNVSEFFTLSGYNRNLVETYCMF